MDALKKFLGLDQNKKEESKDRFTNEFRKPSWFDDVESDDELYDNNKIFKFQIFTNPLEMQKHFEQQMQEMLKTFGEFDDNNPIIDENIRGKYLKPGFENEIEKEFKVATKPLDTDLDNEIYADQLHSLLQRITPPEIESRKTKKFNSNVNGKTETVKRTDDEKIWDRIHGTDPEFSVDMQQKSNRKLYQPSTMHKIPHPRGGVFEGAFQGPKVFRQSIMTQTVRKPDGSYETRKVVRDADGNTNTTITRSKDGKTETITFDGEQNKQRQLVAPVTEGQNSFAVECNRNIFVNDDGYAMPRNIW